ncbi:MAG: hypothetical protein ABW153_08920 [Sedimenticola sp.]
MKAALLNASLSDKAWNYKEMSPRAFIGGSQSTDCSIVKSSREVWMQPKEVVHEGISLKWQ